MAILYINYDSPTIFKEEEYIFSYEGALFKLTSATIEEQGSLAVQTSGELDTQTQSVADKALSFLCTLSLTFHSPFIFTGTHCLGYEADLKYALNGHLSERCIGVGGIQDFPVRIEKYSDE